MENETGISEVFFFIKPRLTTVETKTLNSAC